MKKTIIGLIIIAAMLFSVLLIAISMNPQQSSSASEVFGTYAYNGGHFFIDMIKQVDQENIAHIHGEFDYKPDENMISGTATIKIMDIYGNEKTTKKGTITYEKNVLKIVDEDGTVYYAYTAKTAKEAFWKGLLAVYEFEMHRNEKGWRKISINVVNPDNPSEINGQIIGYQKEIIPNNKFEQMNLGLLGLYGPFKYYIIKIPDQNSGIIVSVKLVITYNNAVIFSQEIGLQPQNPTD